MRRRAGAGVARSIAASYVLRRVGQAGLVIGLTYVLVFFVLFVLPGDPIRQQIDNPQNPLSKADAQILLHYYHLDESPFRQFGIAIGRLLHGDLGYSLTTGQPVATLLRQAIPQTLTLAGTALVFTLLITIVVAFAASFAPTRLVRGIARTIPHPE